MNRYAQIVPEHLLLEDDDDLDGLLPDGLDGDELRLGLGLGLGLGELGELGPLGLLGELGPLGLLDGDDFELLEPLGGGELGLLLEGLLTLEPLIGLSLESLLGEPLDPELERELD